MSARIVRTPGTVGGKPRIDGTRIRPVHLWWFHKDGYSVEEIRRHYSDLTVAEVEMAIAHEQRRRPLRWLQRRIKRVVDVLYEMTDMWDI